MKSAIVSVVAAASMVSAHPSSTLIRRQSAKDFCALDYSDPNAAWTFGGDNSASKFLDKWLSEHTDTNWVYAIDQDTTLHGSVGTANLDCITLDGDNCPPGDTNQCEHFTPPALFHIRAAINTLFEMTKIFKTGFRDNVLSGSLSIAQIKNDFTPQPSASKGGLFSIVNGAVTAAAGVAAVPSAGAPVAGVLTMVAGIFGILSGASSSPAVNDPTADMENLLKEHFAQVRNATDNFIKKAMAGRTDGLDPSDLPGANQAGPNGETQAVARFFAGGKFLFDRQARNGQTPSLNNVMQPLLDRSYKMITQGLVFEALRSNKYYVFVDLARSQDDCNGITGARWIDNRCFTIERDGSPIDRDMALKLDDPNLPYGIDVNGMYNNAWTCYSEFGYDGNVQANVNISLDGQSQQATMPKCFVNLPVIVARKHPCYLVYSQAISCAPGSIKYKQDLFDNLGFSADRCECNVLNVAQTNARVCGDA